MLTIAWDVDEVLNPLISEFLAYLKTVRKDCDHVNFEDITEYHLPNVLPLTKEECGYYIDEFKFKGYYLTLEPNKEILEWFKEYGIYANHIALTSPSIQTAHLSALWVYRFFGEWIRGFHVIPSYRKNSLLDVYDRTKVDWIKRVGGIDIYVEDCQENYVSAKELGIYSFLVKKPWNKGSEISFILKDITFLIKSGLA